MPSCIDHPVTLIPQTGKNDCWAAAAAMVLGNHCIGRGGALGNADGSLNDDVANVQRFADSAGLTFLESFSTLPLTALAEHIDRGPLMICGGVPDPHAYVVAGISGRMIHIFDPAPENVGKDVWVSYDELMSNHPLAMAYLLQRM